MKDGSLDIANNVLDRLDIVWAAIHSNFAQPLEVQTERLVNSTEPKCRYSIPSYRSTDK